MPSNNGYQQLSSHHPYTNYPHPPPSSLGHPSPSIVGPPRPISLEEAIADGSTPPPPLALEDKVVWISDTGPEYGIVKWLGKLPDVGPEWMAGVAFVRPVGSGTGLYNEYKLFETAMNHASLVPIVGLMKAADYLGGTGSRAVDEELAALFEPMPPTKPRRKKDKGSVESYKFYTDKGDASSKSSDSNHFQNSSTSSSTSRSPPKYTVDRLTSEIGTLQTTTNNKGDFEPPTYNYADNPEIRRAIVGTVIASNGTSSNQITTQNQTLLNMAPSLVTSENGHRSSPSKNLDADELFELGSVVEVIINNSTSYYGVIRWLGFVSSNGSSNNSLDIESIRRSERNFGSVIAGIELEEEIAGLTDGTLNGRRLFSCPPNKAYFVSLSECTKDARFNSEGRNISSNSNNITEGGSTSTLEARNSRRASSSLFGSIDCPTVLGDVAPLGTQEGDLVRLCGKNRGIQGHHNSCYLDATLFAMFSSTTVFESLLYRPQRAEDIPEYREVQRILKEEIVNPLRASCYVRADRVMHLRTLLERISSMRGLTSEEKDPEEFLNLLLNQILKTEPYLKLSSGLTSSLYQLFVEKDDSLTLPNVQQLFDASFLGSGIKLREIPPVLIIQMPRFGAAFKMYPRIMPTPYLDITNVLENSPRQCTVCGELAELECPECYGKFGEGLESIAFCGPCSEKSHSHRKRSKHKTVRLAVPPEFVMLQRHISVPRVTMELFAVLCIETSHYVSFVKCGPGPDSPWVFFDSMADRKGEQNGYNIPEVVAFPDLKWWLSEDGYNFLLNNRDDKMIPELPRRLLSDAYICFYSSEVLRYR